MIVYAVFAPPEFNWNFSPTLRTTKGPNFTALFKVEVKENCSKQR
jgi:hypothetical protein